MTTTTIKALAELSRHEPTVAAIAFRSGVSYAETQQEIRDLVEAGLANEIPGTKADAFIPRYTITPDQLHEIERCEFEAADRSIDAGEFSDASRGLDDAELRQAEERAIRRPRLM